MTIAKYDTRPILLGVKRISDISICGWPWTQLLRLRQCFHTCWVSCSITHL